MRSPSCMQWLQSTSAFGPVMHPHFSQVLCSIGVTRGAISNGHEWGFILVKLNENGRGGGYKSSPEIGIDFERDHPHRVMNRGPDIVAGVLAHWVCHCRSISVGCIHKRATDRALL